MRSTSEISSRVLIADDDDTFREAAARVLMRAGYDVQEAADGAQVLEWVRVGEELGLRPPDVIIFDVNMPSFTGVELLADMRRSGRMTPVILMTALCNDEIRAAALQWGAATILEKPFEAESLMTAVINATWLDSMQNAHRAMGGSSTRSVP
jgi:DNA-binding response OmpR family regulator